MKVWKMNEFCSREKVFFEDEFFKKHVVMAQNAFWGRNITI